MLCSSNSMFRATEDSSSQLSFCYSQKSLTCSLTSELLQHGVLISGLLRLLPINFRIKRRNYLIRLVSKHSCVSQENNYLKHTRF